ncbi:MAG: DUF2269 family protein [Methylococcus sp.]|nr:DUF2269 family protein [Methylococcus sp.]
MLKFVHVLGAILIGAGLIGVRISDPRLRQIRELPRVADAIRNIAAFYDGVAVPGAFLLLASVTRLIVRFFQWERP